MIRSSYFYLILFFGFSFSALAQKHSSRKAAKPAVFQGICGDVILKRGNFMPSPDRPVPRGLPVQREVLIFPLLNKNQVDSNDEGFINSVREAKAVKTIKTDKNGKFCVYLPIGRYSLIVREPEGLYANLFDAENNISPVSVQKNRRVDIKVEITHQAAF